MKQDTNLGQVTRRITGYEPGTGDKKDALAMNLGQVTRRIPGYKPRTMTRRML
jgi:hypothetical protein